MIASPARIARDRLRFQRSPRSRHSRPVCLRKGPPTSLRISGPLQYTRSMLIGLDGIGQSAVQRGARSGPVPACRRARRCGGLAGRPAPGRARRWPPPSRPDWRCSFRRSGAALAAGELAARARAAPGGRLDLRQRQRRKREIGAGQRGGGQHGERIDRHDAGRACRACR